MKTWQGRLKSPASRLFESFTSSIDQDKALAEYDIRVSQAHAQGLAGAGVITVEESQALEKALADIGYDISEERLEWRDDLEDVHTHVESWLRERVGELANKLHAGRSRNDQVAADLRLFVVNAAQSLQRGVVNLQAALLELASKYATDVMPGYTHLQQAQPVLIAYPLLAYVNMLDRDWERLAEVRARANRSPLGSGALAGSTFPLDRRLFAERAGLGEPIENSLDAVSDRDFLVEFVFASTLCMTHLSRFAEDIVLWSSIEFGFLQLPDAFASGSSMMPQKKNPDVVELVRGKTALLLGDVTAALALVKGIPGGYNRDLQEDKTPLFHAASTLDFSLSVLTGMVSGLGFDRERCREAISSFSAATDLADHLVSHGLPFRDAHEKVASAVSRLMADGRPLTGIQIDDLDLDVALPGVEPLPDFSPEACVDRRVTTGSTSRLEVAKQLRNFNRRVHIRREGNQ